MNPRLPVIFGAIAAVLWGTLIAGTRSLSERFGAIETAALTYGIAALVVIAKAIFLREGLIASPKSCFRLEDVGRPAVGGTSCTLTERTYEKRSKDLKQLHRKYLIVCGILFLLYNVFLYLAIGIASTREDVAIVGIVNYLWPPLTLLLSIPMLKEKAKWPLIVAGNVIAVLGVVIALWPSESGQAVNVSQIKILPLFVAFLAALCWAAYSNLTALWASERSGVPIFIVATSLALSPFLLRVQWNLVFQVPTFLVMMFLAIFPTYIAYFFWDYAKRNADRWNGDQVLVNVFSYLIPVLSIVTLAVWFGMTLHPAIWAGCAMVVTGAVLSKLGITTGR